MEPKLIIRTSYKHTLLSPILCAIPLKGQEGQDCAGQSAKCKSARLSVQQYHQARWHNVPRMQPRAGASPNSSPPSRMPRVRSHAMLHNKTTSLFPLLDPSPAISVQNVGLATHELSTNPRYGTDASKGMGQNSTARVTQPSSFLALRCYSRVA